MAKNPPKGAGRRGSVKRRSQTYNPKTGTRFVVVGRRDTVVLEAIVAPDLAQCDERLAAARRAEG